MNVSFNEKELINNIELFLASILGHSVYFLFPHLSHVSQHCEDDEAWQKAGQTVDGAGDQGISEWEWDK